VLCRGVGPGLPVGARCPVCGGALGRWGGYRRWVRRGEEVFSLRVARAICRSCERTHALLPSFLFGRRIDLAEAILGALRMAGEGCGHRPIAAAVVVPEATVRGWLRRVRGLAAVHRGAFAGLAFELGARPGRSPPAPSSLAELCEAIGLAHRSARGRFGAAVPASVAAFSVAVSGGLLLANTSCPFPCSPSAVRMAPVSKTSEGVST
jgi:transposase-like protein